MATVQSTGFLDLIISFAITKSIHGARNELMTVYTMMGFESGITILVKIVSWEAPSNFADSLSAAGMVSKNPLHMR